MNAQSPPVLRHSIGQYRLRYDPAVLLWAVYRLKRGLDDKKLQADLSKLIEAGLVTKDGRKFIITGKGKQAMFSISAENASTNAVVNDWSIISMCLSDRWDVLHELNMDYDDYTNLSYDEKKAMRAKLGRRRVWKQFRWFPITLFTLLAPQAAMHLMYLFANPLITALGFVLLFGWAFWTGRLITLALEEDRR